MGRITSVWSCVHESSAETQALDTTEALLPATAETQGQCSASPSLTHIQLAGDEVSRQCVSAVFISKGQDDAAETHTTTPRSDRAAVGEDWLGSGQNQILQSEKTTSFCDPVCDHRLDFPQDTLKPAFTVSNLPGTTSGSAPATSTSMQASSSASFAITNYMASNPAPSTGPTPTSSSSISSSANGTVLKTSSSAGLMQLPSGFTFVSSTPVPSGAPALPLTQLPQGSSSATATVQPAPAQSDIFRFPATVSLTGAGVPQQLQAIQVPLPAQQGSVSSSDSSSGTPQASSASAASVPATIVTSSVPSSIGAQMVYPSPHTVMYASAPSLADGGLAVLNAFSQTPAAMQVSHTQGPDRGAVPQVFLTAPPGTVQFPVSAV
ncbi:hypothetical protein GJAV_G00274100 [Gymnothorax javanicus]|nr:hypothetical protein GJAV_G00274100 [Gymnothorax javanicus]